MPLLYHNNNSISNITSFAQVPSGNPVLLSTATASSSSSISFTSGIDSTYDVYKFIGINIHPSSDGSWLTFQGSTNSGSSYGVTITSSVFVTAHLENYTFTEFQYNTAMDLAQSTSYQQIYRDVGNQNDEHTSGELYIFSPSSTTYVKHFLSTFSASKENDGSGTQYVAGYFNTTSAINAMKFQMNTGNIDAGTIKMYGIK